MRRINADAIPAGSSTSQMTIAARGAKNASGASTPNPSGIVAQRQVVASPYPVARVWTSSARIVGHPDSDGLSLPTLITPNQQCSQAEADQERRTVHVAPRGKHDTNK
jgi:hypothetical protein